MVRQSPCRCRSGTQIKDERKGARREQKCTPHIRCLSQLLLFTAQDQDDSHDNDNTDEKIQKKRHLKLLSLTIRLSHLPLSYTTNDCER
jgi:hypothetical protein